MRRGQQQGNSGQTGALVLNWFVWLKSMMSFSAGGGHPQTHNDPLLGWTASPPFWGRHQNASCYWRSIWLALVFISVGSQGLKRSAIRKRIVGVYVCGRWVMRRVARRDCCLDWFILYVYKSSKVVQWLALLTQSKKILRSNLSPTWGLYVHSLHVPVCAGFLQLFGCPPTVQKTCRLGQLAT